jgi:hypothetical protein
MLSLHFRFSDKNFVPTTHFFHAVSILAHLIIILDLITLIVVEEEHKLWSSSL